MSRKYFQKKKLELFPEIKDWTKEPKTFIKGKTIQQMSYREWFWFDSSAFCLISYGGDIIGALIFFLGAAYFMQKGIIILALFISILAIYHIYSLIKKIMKRKVYGAMTFYDIFLKEK